MLGCNLIAQAHWQCWGRRYDIEERSNDATVAAANPCRFYMASTRLLRQASSLWAAALAVSALSCCGILTRCPMQGSARAAPLGIEWHVPSDEELALASQLAVRALSAPLATLSDAWKSSGEPVPLATALTTLCQVRRVCPHAVHASACRRVLCHPRVASCPFPARHPRVRLLCVHSSTQVVNVVRGVHGAIGAIEDDTQVAPSTPTPGASQIVCLRPAVLAGVYVADAVVPSRRCPLRPRR